MFAISARVPKRRKVLFGQEVDYRIFGDNHGCCIFVAPINTSEISVSTEEEVPAAEFNFIDDEVFETFPMRPLR